MKEKVKLNLLETLMRGRVQHFNRNKYWKMREHVLAYRGGVCKKIVCTYFLYRIKKCDAFNNASLGTHIGYGARFANMPSFPHGLNGIVVSHNAIIGKNCTIYHQVTIGEGNDYINGAPEIGDNVYIGAGAKIIGPIKIGDNVKIGANCVVFKDIPANTTVVCEPPRIICRNNCDIKKLHQEE